MTKTDWDNMINKSKERYNQIMEVLTEGKNKQHIKDLVNEIYNMGFEHGQQYVWFARSGFGMTDEEWQEHRKNIIVENR